jgi:hypothetical protein
VPDEPQPVPPIYQPEVAADAVHWAAHHRRRELWVGFPTVYTILGNRLAPSIAEAYLARTGFAGQQTAVPAAADRSDYLERPVDAERDHGAHGSFGERAHARSPQAWLARHRGGVGALATAALAASALLVRRAR